MIERERKSRRNGKIFRQGNIIFRCIRRFAVGDGVAQFLLLRFLRRTRRSSSAFPRMDRVKGRIPARQGQIRGRISHGIHDIDRSRRQRFCLIYRDPMAAAVDLEHHVVSLLDIRNNGVIVSCGRVRAIGENVALIYKSIIRDLIRYVIVHIGASEAAVVIRVIHIGRNIKAVSALKSALDDKLCRSRHEASGIIYVRSTASQRKRRPARVRLQPRPVVFRSIRNYLIGLSCRFQHDINDLFLIGFCAGVFDDQFLKDTDIAFAESYVDICTGSKPVASVFLRLQLDFVVFRLIDQHRRFLRRAAEANGHTFKFRGGLRFRSDFRLRRSFRLRSSFRLRGDFRFRRRFRFSRSFCRAGRLSVRQSGHRQQCEHHQQGKKQRNILFQSTNLLLIFSVIPLFVA